MQLLRGARTVTTTDVLIVTLGILGLPFCMMAAHVALDHNRLPLLSLGWSVLAVAFAGLLAAIILGVQL
jgi:hypothetical protein